MVRSSCIGLVSRAVVPGWYYMHETVGNASAACSRRSTNPVLGTYPVGGGPCYSRLGCAPMCLFIRCTCRVRRSLSRHIRITGTNGVSAAMCVAFCCLRMAGALWLRASRRVSRQHPHQSGSFLPLISYARRLVLACPLCALVSMCGLFQLPHRRHSYCGRSSVQSPVCREFHLYDVDLLCAHSRSLVVER